MARLAPIGNPLVYAGSMDSERVKNGERLDGFTCSQKKQASMANTLADVGL